MNNALARSARSLGFPPLQSVAGRATIADLVRPGQRTGVYLLGFRTGEAYVGLSKDVASRFIQHCRCHLDIEWFTFKRIPAPKLAKEERRCIDAVERYGLDLRNVALTSFAPPSADLDALISESEQQKFLVSGKARAELQTIPRADDLRRKHLNRFGTLIAHPCGAEAVSGLAAFLRVAVPCPAQTQVAFWSVSAMPGTLAGDLLRVNAHWQELFSAFVDQGRTCFLMLVAKRPLTDAWGPTLKKLGEHLIDVELSNSHLAPGGQDQLCLIARGRTALDRTLALRPVKKAMREFTLRLMRKGPSMWGRSHCPQLVDSALRLSRLKPDLGLQPAAARS